LVTIVVTVVIVVTIYLETGYGFCATPSPVCCGKLVPKSRRARQLTPQPPQISEKASSTRKLPRRTFSSFQNLVVFGLKGPFCKPPNHVPFRAPASCHTLVTHANAPSRSVCIHWSPHAFVPSVPSTDAKHAARLWERGDRLPFETRFSEGFRPGLRSFRSSKR